MLTLGTKDLYIRFAVGRNGFSFVRYSGTDERSHWNQQIVQHGMPNCEGRKEHCLANSIWIKLSSLQSTEIASSRCRVHLPFYLVFCLKHSSMVLPLDPANIHFNAKFLPCSRSHRESENMLMLRKAIQTVSQGIADQALENFVDMA